MSYSAVTTHNGQTELSLSTAALIMAGVSKIHALSSPTSTTPRSRASTCTGELTNFGVVLFGGKSDNDAGVNPDDPSSFKSIDDADDYAADPGTTFIIVPITQPEVPGRHDHRRRWCECHTGNITFHGPLKFVADLAKSMDFGNGSGLKIDVTSDGITITLTIALPDITVGVMSLTNMKIVVALTIPFDGSPVELKFAFCSRDNPFTITVWIFGGGGFVGLTVTTKGVELLEFSFEFGGGFSISFAGLASGKVEVKAGIYFKLESKTVNNVDTQTLVLEAYLRIDGKLSVLGLINILVHFELKLTYTEIAEQQRRHGQEARGRLRVHRRGQGADLLGQGHPARPQGAVGQPQRRGPRDQSAATPSRQAAAREP